MNVRTWLPLLLLSVSMSPQDRSESLDTSFEIAVSERVVISGHLTLEFREVARDSRCPRGVQCVRAGEAVVVLGVTLGANEPTTVTLEVPPGEGASERVGDYHVSVEELLPAADSGRMIPPDGYRATISVASALD